MELNEIYRNKAHLFIPAGAHTYSRTDEVFPENAPRIMEKSKGIPLSVVPVSFLFFIPNLRSAAQAVSITSPFFAHPCAKNAHGLSYRKQPQASS